MPNDLSFLDGGCSPFFAMSTYLSFKKAENSREMSYENAERDIAFERYIEGRKEEYANIKTDREESLRKERLEAERANKREEKKKKLRQELDNQELKLFFKDWPLVLDIHTIIKSLYQTRSLSFILGRHRAFSKNISDPLFDAYENIVALVRKNMSALGVKNENVLTFRNEAKRVGGPALANVFSMMQSLPVIMIMPFISPDKKHLSFYAGIWNEDSYLPLCRKLFDVDYCMEDMKDTEYQEEKIAEIACSATTIFGVFQDTYSMLDSGIVPVFPDHAVSFGLSKYPVLKNFACSEYESFQTFSFLPPEFEDQSEDIDILRKLVNLDHVKLLSSEALSKIKSL